MARKPTLKANFWVGLGASAGGLEALRGLARNVPKDLPVTYIVAQHMAPHHKSMLSEIIGRETDIPVLEVTDNLNPKPNTIYMTPPNHNIIVENGRIRLIDPSKEPGAPKPSVDTFFKSLAKEKGAYAIGIILSGTGSDGAKGILEVRKNGGITIAQDELTAKYSSMPMMAMQTGAVDLVMSPEEIGAQIAKIVSLPRDLNALRASPLNLDGVSELIKLLRDQTKVNFRHYKTATFQRRVERRMAAHNITNLDDYVTIARSSEIEVLALFQDLLISVTSFFRDSVEFSALKDYVSEIVGRKDNDQIRVWVPGMATGEEAYSLAMLFSEAMEAAKSKRTLRLQVFATDIDQNAIEIARRGFYSYSALEQVPEELIEKYFDRAPSGFTVKKSLREKMVFSYHNIAQDPPFLNMDMISCRNLLIYFQANLQAEVFTRFHYSLVPHGVLFLGKSEAVAASEALFRQAGNDKHIFYQRPSHKRIAPRDMTFEKPSLVKAVTIMEKATSARDLADANQRLESLVAGLGVCSLLIDAQLNVVKAYGDTKNYIGFTAGFISTKATSLVKDPYRQDIQALVPGVIRNRKVSKGFTRNSILKDNYKEKITVYPIENSQQEEIMALAVFEEWLSETPNIPFDNEKGFDSAVQLQMENLSNELAIAKANLQQTVEELETSNEELQALNEELQSSNEELQSTNEELETSNEELQSTNEELSTVNEELQVNSGQLTSVNQNLSSILENISVPLLVVDREFRITHASAIADTFFEIGYSLTMPHLGMCKKKPGFPDLMTSVKRALKVGEPISWQIASGEQNATLKVVPYYSTSNELIGAILVVSDNSAELKQANFELQLIFDNAPAAIMVHDDNGKILQANLRALSLLETSDEEDVLGTRFRDYFDQETGNQLAAIDAQVIESQKPLLGVSQRIKYKHGKEIWARMSRIPAAHPRSVSPVVYTVIQDITDQYRANEALLLSEIRLDQAVKASAIGLWDWDIHHDSVFWSNALLAMLKIEHRLPELSIANVTDRIHKDDVEAVKLARRQHFEDKTPYKAIYRIACNDQTYIWVEDMGQAVWDSSGAPVRFTGTLRNVTQEHQTVDFLREQKEQLELAANLSGIGYWKVDLEHNNLQWSDQVHVVHGTNPETFVPDVATAIDFYLPSERAMVQEALEQATGQGKGFNFTATITNMRGEPRVIRSMGVPSSNVKGKIIAIFGVFQDITEDRNKELELERAVEELARSNEELNRFSYVCSHDLKEPVRMIESMASLLVNPKFSVDDAKRSELLQRISTNTLRLRDIIDSLLAYSRIDAKVEFTDVDLNVVLSDLMGGLALAIEECNATLVISKMPTLRGASVHFTQMFHNLIVNALKFTDKTKPVIKVHPVEVENGWRLIVEDNGPGIPTEAREEVFNIFTRLQRRDEVEGTGLGLSIVQRIVLQYGGTIQCTDSAIGGVGFEIFIPTSGLHNA